MRRRSFGKISRKALWARPLLFLGALGVILSGCSAGEERQIPKLPGMKLVWHDEFDKNGLPDSSKWGYDVGGGGWGNDELEYYTEARQENVMVKDGYLTITARKEAYEGHDYTSTRLVSRGKGDWKYGHIEVRAQVPTGIGVWPAIWMMPTESKYGGWPSSGEMDLMEHVGFEPGVVHATVHTEKYYWKKNNQKSAQTSVPDADRAFHVYALDWTPSEVRMSVDGQVYFTYAPGPEDQGDGSRAWPFDQAFHLILNIAVGGSWGGQQGVDDSIFPRSMVVDYVRVYQPER
ncbi:family 16 glycosylhydrolase [Cohnella sp. CFH 77786]|uniref:glycoside hydrolase family 16 protein n=1 Tax=Cohnella sp. CFH 77786 TaxID=2662265 RepID=UPI001C60FC4F|nr:glycoside hydrolase family 16 protein [Cohnella sp. CFH 77786]MBW5445230.1 family 16 glycosylhydrolase [Cohnella sp. CFH 77786]